mmetsp:Transcript_21090/g.29467  ORF Transcript_21090/g.29467 Transcript_21090/m.29467 type:complete len:346 (+) Transcript_21090:79-1116(+)
MPSTDKKEDLLPQESPPDSYDPTENEIGVEVKATRRVSGLSVLTWNVWFGDSYETEESFSKRCQEIVVSLGQTQPDIICLQEVTQDLLDLLLGAGWVKAGYDLSCVKIEGYGVLIMSRGELNGKFEETRLPTHMGRSLHTVHVELSSGRRRTTTITSSSSSSSSCWQCKNELDKLGGKDGDAMLVGDFNFCSYRNYNPEIIPLENKVLSEVMPYFVDLWPRLHPGNKGYTFDSENNTLISRYERMRYDRIMVRSKSMKARSMIRYATYEVDLKLKPEPDRGVVKINGGRVIVRKLSILRGSIIHLSDHFGLMAFLTPLREGDEPMISNNERTQMCDTCNFSCSLM